MNTKPKANLKLRIKRKHKSGHSLTFLRHKRALSVIKAKSKSKKNNWDIQLKNINKEEVKKNFQHFFHINLEEGNLDKDLAELEKVFSPSTFWRLINYSYFDDEKLKEKPNDLLKGLNISNETEDVLLIQDDSDIEDNKNSEKYIPLLNEKNENKINSDFFKQIKSLMKYLKNNNNIISIDLLNDNKDEISSLEKDKNMIKSFIKKIHELNEKNLQKLKETIEKYNSNNLIKININNNEKISKSSDIINNYPILELNKESIKIFNEFMEYINKKEKLESNNHEDKNKIFSFSEKFTNNNNNNLSLKSVNSDNNICQQILSPKIKCCVCNNGDVETNQLIYRCEQCGVTVHQLCYGAVEQELKNWYCDACKEMQKEEVYNLECLLCPVKGGAFKKVELPKESKFFKKLMEYKNNKSKLPNYNYSIIIPKDNYKKCEFAWVHLSCALWNSNISLRNYEKKTGILIENLKYEDFNSYCSLCKKDNCGPTIKCHGDLCECKFHPECARINNCCLEVEIINKEYQYNVYCYKHVPNLLAKRVNLNNKNEVEQIILVNQIFNRIYNLYQKINKEEFYERAKVINEIKITITNIQKRKYKKHKFKKKFIKTHSKFLNNIEISLKKRGRKKKNIKNTSTQTNNNNINSSLYEKNKNLSTIQIENYNYKNNNITNTIINNIGNGNNINIFVNNYHNINTINMNQNQNQNDSNLQIHSNINNFNDKVNLPSPTIEISKNEFDNYISHTKNNNNYINRDNNPENPNEFITFLIGFLNDFTLTNRIVLKKTMKETLFIYKKPPIYFMKYKHFLDENFPWELIKYKNLPVSYIKKLFFKIIDNEDKFEELFLSKIAKTLSELKKNQIKCGRFKIQCDNKEACIGAENGLFDLLSFDDFKYKILDEKKIYPNKFICPNCLSNEPKIRIKKIYKNNKDCI